MKVYELIEKLQTMPRLADVKLVYDCKFGESDVRTVELRNDGRFDDERFVALDED